MFLGSSRISLAFTLEHCVLHFTTFIALLCSSNSFVRSRKWLEAYFKRGLLQYNTVFFDFKNESKERRGGKVNYVWYRKYTWNTFGDFWGQLNCSTLYGTITEKLWVGRKILYRFLPTFPISKEAFPSHGGISLPTSTQSRNTSFTKTTFIQAQNSEFFNTAVSNKQAKMNI